MVDREVSGSTSVDQFQQDDGPPIGRNGRQVFGPTPPSGAVPAARTSPLSDEEVNEVVEIIATGRRTRQSATLPERLWTRHWGSVEKVIVGLDKSRGRHGVGWKVGAAGEEVRVAEGLPAPSPGRIYEGTIFASGSTIEPEIFVNYRNVECEYAFQLNGSFPVRDAPYQESDIRAGIECMFPALELGDTVFLDWYGSSAYFGTCLDNGGGAALIRGNNVDDWESLDLPTQGMSLRLNDQFLKSGVAAAAMGHPVTSLTWMVNWARERGFDVLEGEIVSTGTCTGHCFAVPGDTVSADYGDVGRVEVTFA
jgi:2-keto-4-pentenoate hydratase